MYEVLGCFAIFGVVGFIQLFPEQGVTLGSFTVAFLTYPAAVAEMPGAQFWAFLFFFTLMVLGFSSAFALLDTAVTMICDSEFGKDWKRVYVSTTATVVSFLLSLMYCSEFGFYLLDAVDTWVNNMSLVFVVFLECVAATCIYRYKDIVGVVGRPAYAVYNFCYIGALLFGCVVGHAVSPAAGAGMGFGLFFTGVIVSLLVANAPDTQPPSFWKKNAWLEKFFYLAFYSGYQLTQDLNLVVATGKNWSIPFFWAALLRYISAPILAIVFSLGYPAFHTVRNDPLQIFGSRLGHFCMILIAVFFSIPRMLDVFIPAERRGEGEIPFSPNLAVAVTELSIGRRVEGGERQFSQDATVVDGDLAKARDAELDSSDPALAQADSDKYVVEKERQDAYVR